MALATAATVLQARAADAPAGKPAAPSYLLNLDAAVGKSQVDEKPFPLVLAWLARNVPECPPAAAPEAAAKFVEQLALRHPGEAERLGAGEVPLTRYESLLWQTVALRLKGPAYESLRQQLAVRRVRAVTGQQSAGDPQRAEAAVNHLKNESSAAYRRLTEGRMEDDEIVRLPGLAPERDPVREAATIIAKPRILSAQEIAGEFARRNQTGAAAARLQAYQLEARLRNPAGVEQKIWLFKLRPDRFRIHVKAGGDTEIVAFDGRRYWHQTGTKVEEINPSVLGSLRYFSEFLDPLFGAEGLQFTRLDDQVVDGRKCYQIRVQRADGSAYSALLDQENFHQVARENPDGTKARFSDFRDFAGLTLAHRETLVLANGTSAVLEIIRATPNPGLIGEFFQPPPAERFDLAPVERLLAGHNPP